MLHVRAFRVTVVWTLALLYLGSVVHATESSLACPDWPTCFGTMVPEMAGGVFWEHLHRLVAGGLLLMFGLATWLAHKETPDRPWIFRACLAGLGLLLVQSVLGGVTVLYRLPDAVSTSHLGLAFLFLALATVLASSTGRKSREGSLFAGDAGRWGGADRLRPAQGRRVAAALCAGLVFVQSVLGGLVRHTDAGLACPDAPLCLGQWVPPLVNTPITLHFLHRVLALVVTVSVLGTAAWALRVGAPAGLRRWIVAAAALVVLQVALGFASVLTTLAVIPVSLHTLVAATLLAVLTHVATAADRSVRRERRPEPTAVAAAR